MSRLLPRHRVRLVALVALALATTTGFAAQPSRRANAAAIIAELGGAMPTSFDIYPNDPCSGV